MNKLADWKWEEWKWLNDQITIFEIMIYASERDDDWKYTSIKPSTFQFQGNWIVTKSLENVTFCIFLFEILWILLIYYSFGLFFTLLFFFHFNASNVISDQCNCFISKSFKIQFICWSFTHSFIHSTRYLLAAIWFAFKQITPTVWTSPSITMCVGQCCHYEIAYI